MPTVLFDANGTLFDLAPVREAIGGPAELEAFFERTLHSAAALTMAGAWAPWDEIAEAALATTCAKTGLDVDQEAVLAALRAHAWDVAGARAAGLRAIWVDREERHWPLAGVEPGERAPGLVEAEALAG
jgi:FMN phosphatase YigB (HAD superfamily)